jgi:hypothetical protein
MLQPAATRCRGMESHILQHRSTARYAGAEVSMHPHSDSEEAGPGKSWQDPKLPPTNAKASANTILQ